jgi:acyl-CoA thioesterase YciA
MAETPVHAAPAPVEPQGELSIRTLAMPADTNQNGDIFGGWLLSQMDLAGSIYAYKTTQSRNVTVAIEAMTFRKPVYVGDVVSVYATTVRIGRTSITVHLEAWVQRRNEARLILVTDGNYTYVSVDDDGKPQVIAQQPSHTTA